jgi:hypothetical protein
MKMSLLGWDVGSGCITLHQLIQAPPGDRALPGTEQRAAIAAAFPQIPAQRFDLAIT